MAVVIAPRAMPTGVFLCDSAGDGPIPRRILLFQEQGFDNIVHVVTESKLVASQFVGQLKQPFPSKSRTEKTRIFAIFLAVALSSIVGMLDMQPVAHLLAVILNKVGRIPFKENKIAARDLCPAQCSYLCQPFLWLLCHCGRHPGSLLEGRRCYHGSVHL